MGNDTSCDSLSLNSFFANRFKNILILDFLQWKYSPFCSELEWRNGFCKDCKEIIQAFLSCMGESISSKANIVLLRGQDVLVMLETISDIDIMWIWFLMKINALCQQCKASRVLFYSFWYVYWADLKYILRSSVECGFLLICSKCTWTLSRFYLGYNQTLQLVPELWIVTVFLMYIFLQNKLILSCFLKDSNRSDVPKKILTLFR